MEPAHQISFESLSLTNQQQPSSVLNESSNDEFAKLLPDFTVHQDDIFGDMSPLSDSNTDSQHFNIDSLIGSSNDQSDPSVGEHLNENDDFLKFLERFNPNDFHENFQSQQSTFIEHGDPQDFFQSQPVNSPPVSVPVGSSPAEPKAHDFSIDAQAFLNRQDELIRAAPKPRKATTHQHRSTTVGPIDYILHSGDCQPCTTQIQNDFVYQQQTIEYDTIESKQIQILSEPRPKFRPRTQNESKASSHYIRCVENVKPEYPTIRISREWNFQSDVNIIEVALMGIDKQPHPYMIHNKTSSNTFEDDALIFRQNEPNVLYFRLTNEDFQNGYKTFMIQLIKSKQDDVITKELIRTRQLEHSMLRFTRIFQVRKTEFQRDEGSEVYSTIMSEAYGDVEVEHMGPCYGPMSGQEMVYVVLKGRYVKGDLKIEILDPSTGWSYSVENFTKNVNVAYFLMPAYPFAQLFDTAKVNIAIYHKGEELHQSIYLYKGSLDQELAALHLNDPCTTTASSAVANNFNAFDFFSATGVLPTPSSRKMSTPKNTKRLQKKTLVK